MFNSVMNVDPRLQQLFTASSKLNSDPQLPFHKILNAKLASGLVSQLAAGTFEIKFLLPDPVADRLLDVVRAHLPPDPHCEPELGDAYRINTLYFDTPRFDVFHRNGFHGRRKFRLRRYRAEALIWVERKSKTRGLVRKRRSEIRGDELDNFKNSELDPQLDSTWSGFWFRQRLERRDLRPICQVAYRRVARVAQMAQGSVRFTIDRDLFCRASDMIALQDFSPAETLEPHRLLVGQSIVELKFQNAMPALFKQLMIQFALAPQPISKYRLSVEALGLAKGSGK